MIKPAIPYSKVKGAEILEAAINRIPLSTTKWTSKIAPDIGVTLLELYSGIAEVLGYMADRKQNDLYAPTVRERRNAIKLFELIGYYLKPKSPAYSTCTLSLPSPAEQTLQIPFGFRSASLSPNNIPFVLFEPSVSIPFGSSSVEAVFYQGELQEETYASTGEPNQVLIVPSKDYGYDTMWMYLDGVLMEQVTDFSDSGPLDRHYYVRTDHEDITRVYLPDGLNGYKAPESSSYRALWLNTLGLAGSVNEGVIVRALDTVFFPNGEQAEISITNTDDAQGADKQTVFEAKKLAPSVFAALMRIVTKLDAVSLIENMAGVRQSQVLDINDFPETYPPVLNYFQTRILIIPETGLQPSQRLKDYVRDYVYRKRIVTTFAGVEQMVEVEGAEFIPVGVEIDLYQRRGSKEADVISQTRSVIETFFQPSRSPLAEFKLTGQITGQYFGGDVLYQILSDLVDDLGAVSVVSQIKFTVGDVTYTQAVIPIAAYQCATLASIPVINILGVS